MSQNDSIFRAIVENREFLPGEAGDPATLELQARAEQAERRLAELEQKRAAEAMQRAAIARLANQLVQQVEELKAQAAARAAQAVAPLQPALPPLLAGARPFGVELRGGRRPLAADGEAERPEPIPASPRRGWSSWLVIVALLSGLVTGAGAMKYHDDARLVRAEIRADRLARQLENLRAEPVIRP
ncbi:MAG: hypothetical protein KIT81_03220 [Alphaproteobacteria bacterium]|nr:hypothetical protein [Alphaproteobacteria bacterium]